MQAGDYRRAEAYARESMPLVRGVIYEGNDLYADSLATLAMALDKQRRLAEAEPLYREFLNRQIDRLGPDHLLVGRTWNNLSNVLRSKGDYDAAERALDEAIRIDTAQLGPEGLDLAIAYHNLGGLLRDAGNPAAGLTALEKALAMKRKAVGPRSPLTVSTLLEKSAALRELGQIEPARAALAEADSIAVEKFDRDDRRHGLVLAEKGRLELASGNAAAAEHSLQEAVHQMNPQDEGRVSDALASLGEALVRNGHFADARDVLTRTLEIRRKILPAGHWGLADAQSRLGEALSLLGDREQARPLLADAVTQLRAKRPKMDAAILAAERRLHEHDARGSSLQKPYTSTTART
jgi:tetratricopeptide (TPR) repeat protein